MQVQRTRERITVEIPIVITTVLDSLEGMIVDLSEGGAQVIGCSLPAKTQCQVDLDGHIVFGIVRWSEEDRMGIRFPYDLTDGPLLEKLDKTRAARRAPMAACQPAYSRPSPTPYAPLMQGGFGRRIR
ncbi:PilZ domain-containing protein [Sphingobium faniae]|nr:PilZ domain-containing protein [Sphingobium faniae]